MLCYRCILLPVAVSCGLLLMTEVATMGVLATSNEQIVASTVVYIHISNLSKRNGMENIKFNYI